MDISLTTLLPCSFSVDHHCQQFERHAGKLRAELLHCSQASNHLCHCDGRHCSACTRWVRQHSLQENAAVFNLLDCNNVQLCCFASAQEEQKIYQTHLKVRQRRLDPSVLHFTMDSGLMMDGKHATFFWFHSEIFFWGSEMIKGHRSSSHILLRWTQHMQSKL